MQNEVRPRDNRLGVIGWFWGGSYKFERYLFIIHRVTGLCLLLFVAFHLVETTFFRIQGQSVWQMTTAYLNHPAFEVGLVLVTFAFAIHALNGLRLVLTELGFGLGKPVRPVYPYRDALRRRRGYTFVAMGGMAIFLAVFILNLAL